MHNLYSGWTSVEVFVLSAPIALFVYNRPDHARQTIDALRQNNLAQESDLVIFSDVTGGAKCIQLK